MAQRTVQRLVLLACIVLLLAVLSIRKPAPQTALPVGPAVDLRRVTFSAEGVTVSEQSAARIQIVTDRWMLGVNTIDSRQAENFDGAHRSIIARERDCRQDLLKGPGGLIIRRVLRGIQTAQRASEVDYLISIGNAWAIAHGVARTAGDPFDVTPIDNCLLTFKLADKPRLESEIPPAWLTYQKTRTPGTPIAKFVLFMAPAPVRIGNYRTSFQYSALFTDADYRRGGRQIAPDVVEFYTKDDSSSVRIDFWLDRHADAENGEPVFSTTLQINGSSTEVWSTADPHNVPVPAGDYAVSVTVRNRGKDSDQSLTDQERFQRNDLERYEVFLERRPVK